MKINFNYKLYTLKIAFNNENDRIQARKYAVYDLASNDMTLH